MLRDPSLIPLSHQHQHALALCVTIDRTLRQEASAPRTSELVQKVLNTYDVELRNHFEVEERLLFPAIREHLGPTPLVDELQAEHRRLEALVERVRTAGEAGRPAALAEFAVTLTAHIRREERELFEDIQKRLSPETLAELGRGIDRDVVRVCL
jgi:hemerythrin-like domain-containing protein